MGTRADFYVGRGNDAEWLGSIAYDGYPDGIPEDLLNATTEDEFRNSVAAMSTWDDWTRPEDGWPWPWEDSRTTDYAYAFDLDEKRVLASSFGGKWFHPASEEEDDDKKPEAIFPNMKDRQKITFGPRSGIMVLSTK